MKKLNIVIFTVKNHMYANTLIKTVLEMKQVNVIAIVESSVLYPGKNTSAALRLYVQTAGSSYLFAQIAKMILFRVLSALYSSWPGVNPKHSLYSYKKILKKRGLSIPCIAEHDINREEFRSHLSATKSDLFVSLLFNQVFRQRVLSIPTLGTINFHPALLPKYRGVSPTFWVLANGEKFTGVTIHQVTNKEIDSGHIIAQQTVPIFASDTEDSLYWRCVRTGKPLLKKVLAKIGREGKISKQSTNRHRKPTPSYFSIPTKEKVREFQKKRKFFHLKNLFSNHS